MAPCPVRLRVNLHALIPTPILFWETRDERQQLSMRAGVDQDEEQSRTHCGLCRFHSPSSVRPFWSIFTRSTSGDPVGYKNLSKAPYSRSSSFSLLSTNAHTSTLSSTLSHHGLVQRRLRRKPELRHSMSLVCWLSPFLVSNLSSSFKTALRRTTRRHSAMRLLRRRCLRGFVLTDRQSTKLPQ